MTPTLKEKGRSKKTGRRNERAKKKAERRLLSSACKMEDEQEYGYYLAKSCLGTKKAEEGNGVPSMFGGTPKETANQRDSAI